MLKGWEPKLRIDFDELQCAYLAGLIDGEGTISINKSGPSERAWLHPTISITNKSEQLMQWLQESTGIGYKANIILGPSAYNPKGVYFKWIIKRRADCLKLLELVKPFLIIKEKECDLVIEFCRSRLNQSAKKHYSARELEIYKIVGTMHSKGPIPAPYSP